MYNILRAYITASRLLIDATEEQIDERGRTKAVASVWAEMPQMSSDVIQIADQLMDNPELANGEAHATEERWLKAIIDEATTTTTEPTHSDEDSWASLARSTAWFSFCLKQAASYAADTDYGENAFQEVREQILNSDDFEKSLVVSAVTGAAAHIESMDSPASKEIVATYDELIRDLA